MAIHRKKTLVPSGTPKVMIAALVALSIPAAALVWAGAATVTHTGGVHLTKAGPEITLNVPGGGYSVSVGGGTKIVSSGATVKAAGGIPVGRSSKVVRTTTKTGPNASTTGVPKGTTLTNVYGDQHITKAGTVITGENIHGFVFIEADNVTIQRSVIQGRAVANSASDIALVMNMKGHRGLIIRDSELYAASPSYHIKGIITSNTRIARDNIHDVTDAVHIVGSNVEVKGSWTHGNLHYSNDPNNGNGPTHDDSVQIQAGSNLSFLGNRFQGAHNSVVQITQDSGVVSNVRFSLNYADGGNCSINVLHKSRPPVRGVVVTDNQFGTDTGFSRCAVVTVSDNASTMSVSGNTFVDGKAAPLRVFCADLLHLCK